MDSLWQLVTLPFLALVLTHHHHPLDNTQNLQAHNVRCRVRLQHRWRYTVEDVTYDDTETNRLSQIVIGERVIKISLPSMLTRATSRPPTRWEKTKQHGPRDWRPLQPQSRSCDCRHATFGDRVHDQKKLTNLRMACGMRPGHFEHRVYDSSKVHEKMLYVFI